MMELVHRVAHQLMLGIFNFWFYFQIINIKPKSKAHLLGITLSIAILLFLLHAYIREPVRIFIGLLAFGFFVYRREQTASGAALILAFLTGYSITIASLLLSSAISTAFGIYERELFWVVNIAVKFCAYLTAYRIARTWNGIPSINMPEVQGIVFSAAGIVAAFYGIAHMTSEDTVPFLRAFVAAFVIVVVTGIFFLSLFAKRYRERLEAEKQRLALEKDHKHLKEKNHEYQEVVPTVKWTNAIVLDKIKHIAKQGDVAQLQELERYLTLVAEINTELAEAFTLDDLVKEYRGFTLPEEWLALKVRIIQTLSECERKDYLAFAQNTATTWGQIQVSKVKIIRLVGNLLKNAVRELGKTKSEEKELRLRFYDDESGFFAVEVSDNAHPFPSHVLARLGERGNSTNGTGDGYAEIFRFLSESGASLLIEERVLGGGDAKTVRIVFDCKERLVVCTEHRYDELKIALENTGFRVKSLS